MNKVDQVIAAMPEEAAEVLMQVLTRRTPNGERFLISASKVAELVSDNLSDSLGKDSVLSWRKTNV